MEYMTPNFTKDMVKTHKILIPNMAVTQFRLMQAALASEGYQTEVLGNCGSEVAQLGLKYVHNDTCYPALLVIGQFLDALNSGKYDLDHTALLITQTGGGCRASNYIHLLRKALVKAGYPQIPVASLNFSGLEKDSGFQMTIPLARRALACIFYGDMLCALRNQVAPYENEKGAADKMVDLWVTRLGRVLLAGKGYTAKEMKHTFPLIAADFANIPVTRVPKVKVGVVGETSYVVKDTAVIRFSYLSPDAEGGFPGNLNISLAYKLTHDNEVILDYRASTDKPTVVNLTNHSYFNLTGCKESVLNHYCMIDGDSITPVDAAGIPTGELMAVAGTEYDFRTLQALGGRIGELKKGYDTNYKLNKQPGTLALAAKIVEPESGRVLKAYTTEPGMQFYTPAANLDYLKGHGKQSYGRYYGFCLEMQHFPDSPHNPHFPTTVLLPGETYRQTTVYRFETLSETE